MPPLISIEELKKLVMQMADLGECSPAICIKLSELIYERTGKRLSVITLKRVYGFAVCKYKLSGYTINLLAEFCNDMDLKNAG